MNTQKHLTLWITFSLALSASLAGCRRANQPGSRTFIGTIQRVSDFVQINENELTGTGQLGQGDSLRLFEGGEGILDFGSDLRLRLFNETEIGGVRSSLDPETPVDIKLILFAGGFVGQLFRPGGNPEFETPNGAVIKVFATTFIVVYDRENGTTYCGNFEGDVRIESAGSPSIPIPSGKIYRVLPGEEPEEWNDIPWTPVEYEVLARTNLSPLTPLLGLIPSTGSDETPIPTFTRTPTRTNTVTPTEQPSITPIPSETPLSCPPAITVDEKAFCREGPGQIYEASDSFLPGTVLQAEGRNADDSWWWVQGINTSRNCWISDVTVNVEGVSSCLPIIPAPPTYTLTPTSTQTVTPTLTLPPVITDTPTPTSTQTVTPTLTLTPVITDTPIVIP